MPMSPAAISHSAVTPGLFFVSIFGAWPWLSMRARYVAASTSWNRFGIFTRQSSTVMRAMACSEEVEGSKHLRSVAALGRVLQALRVDDGLQVEERGLEQLIDYNEVEVLGLCHLDARIGQARGDHLGSVFTTALQPLLQFGPARRQDEDEDRVRKQLLDLQRALPVDLEHHVIAVHQTFLDRGARGAVQMPMHLRPLEELPTVDHRAESGLVDEPVLTAV